MTSGPQGSNEARSNTDKASSREIVRAPTALGHTADVVETDRQRAIALVRQLMTASGTERQLDAAMAELESIVPDPNVSDLIYWPGHHERSRGLRESELTPDKIVELAYRYKPFAL